MGSTEALPKELNRRRAAVGRVCVTATSLLLVRQNRLGRSLKSRVESACEHAIRNARGDGDCDDSSPRARDALHVLRCWRASCQSCQRGARACRALPPLAMPAAAATLQVGAEVVELLDEACFAPLRERFAAPAGFLAGAPLSAPDPHPSRPRRAPNRRPGGTLGPLVGSGALRLGHAALVARRQGGWPMIGHCLGAAAAWKPSHASRPSKRACCTPP